MVLFLPVAGHKYFICIVCTLFYLCLTCSRFALEAGGSKKQGNSGKFRVDVKGGMRVRIEVAQISTLRSRIFSVAAVKAIAITRRCLNRFTESSRAKCLLGRNVVAQEAGETCLSVVTSVSAHSTFPPLLQPLDLTCANCIFRSAGV